MYYVARFPIPCNVFGSTLCRCSVLLQEGIFFVTMMKKLKVCIVCTPVNKNVGAIAYTANCMGLLHLSG